MRKLRSFWMRLVGAFGTGKADREFAAELEAHLAMHIEDGMRAGLDETEARRQAMIRLGGVEQTRQAHRERRGLPWAEMLIIDIRFGSRMLAKSPGYTAVAVVTLALGIGVTSAVFSVAETALLRSWPARNPQRIVEIIATMPHDYTNIFSYPDYEDLAGHTKSLEGILAYSRHAQLIQVGAESKIITDEVASPNFFSVLGTDAKLAHAFAAASTAGSAKSVVISDSLWRSAFNADPALLGKQVSLTRRSYTVIGIAPRGFRGLKSFVPVDLWIPATTELLSEMSDRKLRDFQLLGRLRPGATAPQARAELQLAGQRLAQSYPGIDGARNVDLVSDRERLRRAMVPTTMLMAIVGLVLLICCANVAGLTLARADSRRKEMAVRLALGATRLRLFRQLLTESLLLSAAGAALGLLVTAALFHLQPVLVPQVGVELGLDLHLDASIVSFTTALSVLSILVFGFAPAMQASKASPAPALKRADQTAGHTARRLTMRNVLVVGEIALSAMLLTASGLVVRSLLFSRAIDLGFDHQRHLLFFDLLPDVAGYNVTRSASFLDQVESRAATLPGVKHAALAQRVLLSGTGGGAEMRASIPGLALPQGQHDVPIKFNTVDSSYFQTMGTRLIEGRTFTSADDATSGNAVVISRAMANRFWPDRHALGLYIVVEGKACEVIGVVEDAKINDVHEKPEAYMYLPFAQWPRSQATLILDAEGDTRVLAENVRAQIQRLGPGVPIESHSVHELMNVAFWADQMIAGFVTTLGLLASFLGAIGLYGVIAFVVNRRTQEIGIRMALGAGRRDIVRMVVGQGLALTAIGTGVGLAGSLLATRLMSTFLYGVKSTDSVAFAGSAVLIIAVALVACWVPARRAASINPTDALRAE